MFELVRGGGGGCEKDKTFMPWLRRPATTKINAQNEYSLFAVKK